MQASQIGVKTGLFAHFRWLAHAPIGRWSNSDSCTPGPPPVGRRVRRLAFSGKIDALPDFDGGVRRVIATAVAHSCNSGDFNVGTDLWFVGL